MEKISLYRKYRPHNFENLVGQKHIKDTLINALKSGHVAHAYLFAGPRGTGKTSTARLIAKSLNCVNLKDGFEPCGSCEFCEDINSGRLIDLIEIDAASNRGIDEMRDLKEKINFAPTRAEYKIYIIDEVHMLTKEAFNALLKTLEEPPEHAYFILATTEVHKIPDTIISRCQRFDFRRVEDSALIERLMHIAKNEKVEAEEAAVKMIAKYADGGLRDAIGLLEQLTIDEKVEVKTVQEILGMSDVNILEDLYATLIANDTVKALGLIENLHSQGADLRQFIHEFVDVLRFHMLKAVENQNMAEMERLINMIDIFQDAQQKLAVGIPQLPLEIAVVRVSFLFSAYKDQKVAQKTTPAQVNVQNPVKNSAQKVEMESQDDGNTNSVERDHKGLQPDPAKKDDNQKILHQGELSLDIFVEKWQRVVDWIKVPALRMSLKNARPVKFENGTLTLQFGTNFHKDKVVGADNLAALEKIIIETLGSPVKVAAIVKEIEIKPVVDEPSSFDSGPPPVSEFPQSSSKPSEVNDALDIFGGEVVN